VPAYPGIQQLIGVGVVGQDAAKIAQREALLFSIRLGLAVLAFAVVAVQRRGNRGQLFAFSIIVGGRERSVTTSTT